MMYVAVLGLRSPIKEVLGLYDNNNNNENSMIRTIVVVISIVLVI